MMSPIILLLALVSSSLPGSQTENDSSFINPSRIIVSAKTIVEPSPAEFEWAANMLSELGIDGKTNFEKAEKILCYVTANYKYRIRSPRTITGFIDMEGGNCVSHSIAGLFLLRMAGIPAKLCYEYHVKNWMVVDQWRANANNAAYFGAGHNS
ncbi:MAG: transglutaminase domain-containing protein, partial [Bacteroidales bacterium]|nr:transglutaminase domain-containing protein [Bacteroidales bacterium]